MFQTISPPGASNPSATIFPREAYPLRKPIFLAFLSLPLAAQTPQPELSPKAAYDEAMHPLELTRNSITNWSDTELAALTVTIGNARTACAERPADGFNGSELLDLARLCALGQSYPEVIVAATRYLKITTDPPRSDLAFAYGALINAQLHIKDEAAALAAAKTMLAAVPYDAVTAEAIDAAINYMQFVHTKDALALATLRQPLLLATMTALATPPTIPAAQPLTLHDLYNDGLALAALQQLSKSPSDEIAATVAVLDAALPADLSADDAIPIAAARRRYALLGRPLPDLAHPLHPAVAGHPAKLIMLAYPGQLPQLPSPNAMTALVLFPDWCAQCLHLVGKFPETVFTVSGHEAYLYGLLAPTTPQKPPPTTKPDPSKPVTFSPADATNLLRGFPVLVADPSFLDQFAAGDFPFLILADAHGIVRVAQPVDENAINPGSTIDAAIARVGEQWPLPVIHHEPAKLTH